MRNAFFLMFVCVSLVTNAQTIITVAGDGTLGDGDGIQATATSIGYPDGCAFDSRGNFYFTQVAPDKVRKISASGIITTVVGTASEGYNGDNIVATSAELNLPGAIAFDRLDNMYIADGSNNRIRKVDAVTGIITTFAGTGVAAFGGDNGPASAAQFNGVADICFDWLGNLYVADAGNNRIRKINASGIITTVVGTNTGGHSGDGRQATAAEIEGVEGICVDRLGNLYLAESSDAVVRMVNTSGIITTIAGNGHAGPSGDGGPATAASLALIMLAADSFGNLFISGYLDNDVRAINKYGIINTIAGTAVFGFSGDGGPATSAKLSSTYGIALDSCGNVFVADKNNYRIRKIALNPNCIPAKIEDIKNEQTIISVALS